MKKETDKSAAEAVLVIGLYEESPGTILMPLTRSNVWMPSRWNILGGKVKVHETKEVAAEREYHEEAGLCIKNLRLYDSITKDSWNAGIAQHIQHVYIAEIETLSGFLAYAQDGEKKLTNGIFSVRDILRAVKFRQKLNYNRQVP